MADAGGWFLVGGETEGKGKMETYTCVYLNVTEQRFVVGGGASEERGARGSGLETRACVHTYSLL